ncbi:MAG: hypothetical protein A2X53_06550 [Candidatus Rokubacteria bacterium GWA2_70_23]|nr:MAG: hypothetical protein A2X53_06550 [Candidatus Rokubacteria bacterium GWA2_70_23]
MAKLAWKPWHKVVALRDDLRSGELSLAAFAADLHAVAVGTARPVYQDPREFFALTYPTFNLRELAKDVVLRLAGRNDKAVRQLELTYGGGKTHALITLFHLVRDPASLPDLPAVQEFVQHIGMTPPKTRVAVLSFDQLDPVTGMDVQAPDGSRGRFRYPWSVLAWALGGHEGLATLGAKGDTEREEPPFVNVMGDLLRLPARDGLATLVLIDEVLMWARTKIGSDPIWRHRVQDFFQCLTQAATGVSTCAVVASLLATDPRKSDALGKEIAQELYAIFRREREEGVQPVVKEDVAEVLRRRFFKPESIRDREAFRPHVVAALKGIGELDDQTRKDGAVAENRYLRSYPFHPDLTEVLYGKWTSLEGFQRTRGVLRTFALALRDSERWDECPLVTANVFLGESGKATLSEAARELTTTASMEEYDGKKYDWSAILDGELTKAQEVQSQAPGLRFREVEQAVVATFLHSQPIGQKAMTRELLVLLGHCRPDRIELEKGLLRWIDASWYLDEAAVSEAAPGSDGRRQLPKIWRLGPTPNLTQMHHEACLRVAPEVVDSRLLDDIQRTKSLTAAAAAAGARVHNLPPRPSDIEDSGEFHYAVLGPKAASDPGKPSSEARRFLDETTGADRPRVYRNAVVLAVPSRDGLDAARSRIKEHLGWEEVRHQLRDKELDPIREAMLTATLEGARKKIPEAVQQAYCLAVTVSEKNEVQAFKVAVGSEALFVAIKADKRARIQDTAISAEALLPGGPYDLWRGGETSRRVRDLVGAFAQFPHLPKMLNARAILDTLVGGCLDGSLVLRLARPDRSVRTFWRETPDDPALRDAGLEAVLPEVARLASIEPALLIPGALPGLWQRAELSVGALRTYFSGGHVVQVKKGGYEEPRVIPGAEPSVVDAAIRVAVQTGKLWLTSGPASILAEEIPPGLLSDDAELHAPPGPISPTDLVPTALPDAWADDATTGLSLAVALSTRAGRNLPWVTIRDAVDGALRVRILELTLDSAPWPSSFAGAQAIKLRQSKDAPRPTPLSPKGVLVAESEVRPNEIQDLADQVGELVKLAIGLELKFALRVELGGAARPSTELLAKINEILRAIRSDLELR